MWYEVFKVPFRALARWGYGGRVVGEDHIPATGGVILASNHISEIDTYVMPALIRRKVTFPAKAELFAGNRGLGSKIVAWFLRAVGQVPLDRSGGAHRSTASAPSGTSCVLVALPGSIPRARGRRMAVSTRARRASPAWR